MMLISIQGNGHIDH